MSTVKKGSDPLENFTEEQFANLEESINALDQVQKSIEREELYELDRRKSADRPFQRLRKSPLEIINRVLFFIFIGCFLFSFSSFYVLNKFWFFLYLISAFSCILYTPNRKALKELIAAWPNIEDLLKKRSLWR
tara:strand:+ start:7290 stop:7691 length:402 start_codon:yes stop_codon:yes gene_type:complete